MPAFQRIQQMLRQKTYKTSSYICFQTRCSGKVREISKLPYFPDRIVHHAIMQVVGPIWFRTLIADTYACIPGRGIHQAAKKIRRALLDQDAARYCLKCDVKKFYPSVDHDILKAIIRQRIKDPDLLWLLDGIIDSAPGIPIGNYLSQHFGNLYLSDLDHWLKEQAGCKHYYRYCDDLVILHGDKGLLHELRKKIEHYLWGRLHLELKGNWQVFPVKERGVDFLGYRFFPGYTLARKRIAAKFKRKVHRVCQKGRVMEPSAVVNSLMSYHGWFMHADCRNLTRAYITDEIRDMAAEACERGGVRVPAPLESAA